jgi:DNA replication licensing factor MCM6
MQIRGEGLADETAGQQEQRPQQEGKVTYVLHPMCPVEDIV